MGVYRGIAADNLNVTSGSFSNVTITGGVSAPATLKVPALAATAIAAIGNAVNTTGKAAGTVVFDTTNGKLKIATGAATDSTWVDADGTNAVTPA